MRWSPTANGKEAVHDLVERWRYGGSLIDEVSHRREAFNIMLSMPEGTDPRIVLQAARDFAQAELKGHSYVMVLHEHQANPHMHLAVRAESRFGDRLSPRKADLHRWRETFAEKLRSWGIEAEATRQATRFENRNFEPLWRVKAKEEDRLRKASDRTKTGKRYGASRAGAAEGWAHVMKALAASDRPEDRELAERVAAFLRTIPLVRELVRPRQSPAPVREGRRPPQRQTQPEVPMLRRGPEIEIER